MQRNHHAHITRHAFDNGNKKLFTLIHRGVERARAFDEKTLKFESPIKQRCLSYR